jgi:hypothetical protein
MTSQDPDRIKDLGARLEEVQRRNAAQAKRPPPNQLGIAGRFATELVAALVVAEDWDGDWIGFWAGSVFTPSRSS